MEIHEIIAHKREIERELLGKIGVLGVDVGYKYKAGKRSKQVVIRVYVSENKRISLKLTVFQKVLEGLRRM